MEIKYFEILILALSMREARDNGNSYEYEASLLRLALDYHSIFISTGNSLMRQQLIEALSKILPDYFGHNFDKHGQYKTFNE